MRRRVSRQARRRTDTSFPIATRSSVSRRPMKSTSLSDSETRTASTSTAWGGALWVGDVGDSFREEINEVVAGGNYQWPFIEGTRVKGAGSPVIGSTQAPAFEYLHATLGDLTAVMGGYVYRGEALPELVGLFIYSDWPTGRVWHSKLTRESVDRGLSQTRRMRLSASVKMQKEKLTSSLGAKFY